MDLVKSDVVDLRMVVLFGPRVPSLLFGEGVLHTDTTWPFWSAKPGIFGTSVLPQLLHLEVSTPHAPDRMHHPMEGVVHVFLLRAAAPNAHIIINMRLDVQPYDVSLEKDFATLLPNVNKPADDVGSLHVAALEVVVTDMDAVVPALRLLSPRVTVEELILTCEQDLVMDAAQRELYTRIEAMQLESIMVGYAENMDFDVRAIMALPSRSSAKDVTIPACSTFGNDILAAVRRLNNYPSLVEVVLDCQCSIVDFDPRALAAIPHAVKHIHVMNVMFEIGFISFMCNLFDTCGKFAESISVHVTDVHEDYGTHGNRDMLAAMTQLAEKVLRESADWLLPIKLKIEADRTTVALVMAMVDAHPDLEQLVRRAADSLEVILELIN